MKSLHLEFVFGSGVYPLPLASTFFSQYKKNCIFGSEVSKNEQPKFTINVNNKKWLLFYYLMVKNFSFWEKKSQLLPVFSPKQY